MGYFAVNGGLFDREGGLNGREWWAIRAKYSSKSAT